MNNKILIGDYKMRNNFIEYLGTAHLNNMNIAVYKNENGVTLKAENVKNDKVFGYKEFLSYEDAQKWFSELPGINSLSRLSSALETLS